MRLHRMTLLNFGGVREQTIDFGPNVTVVAGPNEVGKSSFQAALRLLFHYPDNSSAASVRGFVPTDQDGAGPEVDLEAQAGACQFVYRKRWRHKPKTELVIRTPKPPNFTVRDAHNRAQKILQEAEDYSMFDAKQLMQLAPLAQADLENSFSLSQALDKAAGGSDPSAENDSLYEAVIQSYERYWTLKTGRETGELSRVRESAQAVATMLSGFELQLADLAGHVEAVASGERDLQRKEDLILRLERQLRDRQADVETVSRLEKELAELRTCEARASLANAQAKNAQDERRRLLDSEAEAEVQLRQLEEQMASAQRTAAALQAAAEHDRASFESATGACDRAVEERGVAEQMVDYLKSRTAHAALENRICLVEWLTRLGAEGAALLERFGVEKGGLCAS